jgi:hypothetical protein
VTSDGVSPPEPQAGETPSELFRGGHRPTFQSAQEYLRSWLKHGLGAIDDRRPLLVLGRELSRFLYERRQKRKRECGPGRIYCLACRAPKIPGLNMVECTPTGVAASLCGICPDCGRLMYRHVNLSSLDAIRGELEITFRQPSSRLRGSPAPLVNCDSRREGTTE